MFAVSKAKPGFKVLLCLDTTLMLLKPVFSALEFVFATLPDQGTIFESSFCCLYVLNEVSNWCFISKYILQNILFTS